MTRCTARAAVPARKGRRAGQPVRSRDLSLTRARRLILAAIRFGRTGYQSLTREISRFRNTCDRDRHPAPQVQIPQHVPARRAEGHGHTDRPGRHHPRQRARLTSGNTGYRHS
jgi:hypothetical protein